MSTMTAMKKAKQPKPVYKRKKNKTNSHSPLHQKITTYHPKDMLVNPSDKYADTMRFLKSKGYFIDAEYGTRVRFESIKEFHVDKKGVPVVLATANYHNKKGDLVSKNKVYRIIRYNEKQIVGMVTENRAYSVLPKVRVDTSLPPEKTVPVMKKN